MNISSTAIIDLLNRVEKEALFSFVKIKFEPSAIFKGFSVSKKNMYRKVILKRIARSLKNDYTLFLDFLDIPSSPWNELKIYIAEFKEEELLEEYREILKKPGGHEIIPAMLLDDRKNISKKGEELFEDEDLWKETKPKKHFSTDIWDEILEEEAIKKNKTETTEKHKHEIKHLHDEIKELSESKKHIKYDLLAKKKEFISLEKQTEKKNKELEKKIRTIKKQLSEKDAELEKKIKDGINNYRKRVLQIPKNSILTKHSFSNTAEILETADKILAEQAVSNELHGTLQKIRDEIELLENKLSKVNICLHESIVINPELIKLKKELNTQILKLKKIPQLKKEQPKIAIKFINAFKKAVKTFEVSQVSIEKIEDLKNILKNSTINKILRDDIDNLKKQLKDREIHIANILKEKALLHIDTGEKKSKEPIQFLSLASLEKSKKLIKKETKIIVDGYNVIKRDPTLAAKAKNDFAKTRKDFIHLCGNKAN
ncbi:MAG: hypothetical protein U9O87_00380, partial [Verrucomicrobiota bacterium]|nr:hypothetical protein [Verrucomicrobiota bacterium]